MYMSKNYIWRAGHCKNHELFVHGLKLRDMKLQTQTHLKLSEKLMYSAILQSHRGLFHTLSLVITSFGCLNNIKHKPADYYSCTAPFYTNYKISSSLILGLQEAAASLHCLVSETSGAVWATVMF